jgi:hypothetical protein
MVEKLHLSPGASQVFDDVVDEESEGKKSEGKQRKGKERKKKKSQERNGIELENKGS